MAWAAIVKVAITRRVRTSFCWRWSQQPTRAITSREGGWSSRGAVVDVLIADPLLHPHVTGNDDSITQSVVNEQSRVAVKVLADPVHHLGVRHRSNTRRRLWETTLPLDALEHCLERPDVERREPTQVALAAVEVSPQLVLTGIHRRPLAA
jgi:hypothetical protein